MSKLLICCLQFYQKYRIRSYPVCRYTPSCSDYSIVALQKYSLGFAVFKIVGRLLRCQPLWCSTFCSDEP